MTTPTRRTACLASIPEAHYAGLSRRFRYCQRRADHYGEHRSWSRTWNTDDLESCVRGNGISAADSDAEDARDVAIARQRVAEIADRPDELVSGPALEARLDELLSSDTEDGGEG